MIVGNVKINDIICPFSFDEKVLYIHMTQMQIDGVFLQTLHFDVLAGVTSDFRGIYFINCNFYNGTGNVAVRPFAYIRMVGGHCDYDLDRKFDSIKFLGGILNSFYTPKLAFDQQNSIRNEDGSEVIAIKDTASRTRTIPLTIGKYHVNAVLSVYNTIKNTDEKLALGDYHASLRLDFAEPCSIVDIQSICNHVHRALAFLNYNATTGFDGVSLLAKQEDEQLDRVGELHVPKFEEDREILPHSRSLHHDDFEQDQLDRVFQLVVKDDFYRQFLPANKSERGFIGPKEYQACCSCFEHVYDICMLSEERTDETYSMVQGRLLSELDRITTEAAGPNGKCTRRISDQVNIFRQAIEHASKPFANQLGKAMKAYRKCIESTVSRAKRKYSLTDEYIKENLAWSTGDYRNKVSHGTAAPLEKIHIVGFVVTRALIYAMVFRNAGLTDEKINVLLQRLF